MSVRSSLLALCLAASPASAAAQVVSSGPLQQVDPWGVGWLGQADGALSSDIWKNTSAASLKPLMETIDPARMSPAARDALRLLMMSAARSPENGDELIPERLRLLEGLGETARADDLRSRFTDTEWGAGGEQRAAAFALLDGRARGQCARIAEQPADDPAWMPARALCYAIAEDYDAAALLGEQAAETDPDLAAWLLSAIENKREAARRPPEARFNTPFEAAVSLTTNLPADLDDLAAIRPDMAAIILRHPSATPEQKGAVLPAAVEGGQIAEADIVAILTPDEEDAAPPEGSVQAALLAAGDAEALPADKAAAYAAALAVAERPGPFLLTALALHNALGELQPTDETSEQAALFARAALAVDDAELAGKWRAAIAEEDADVWSNARLDIASALAGARLDDTQAAISSLIAASPLAEDAERPDGRAARAAFDARLAETTRILFLLVGTGRALPPEGRALLAGLRTTGNGVSDPAISRAQAANNASAPGEAALAALSLIAADPSTQSYIGLADALTQLRAGGFEAAADAIALEALQLHKAF